MAGMSKEEAKSKIEAMINEKLEKEMNVSFQDYNTTINATILEINYDINTAVENAISIGRGGNLISNNYEIIK